MLNFFKPFTPISVFGGIVYVDSAEKARMLNLPVVHPSALTRELVEGQSVIRLPKNGGSFQIPAFQVDENCSLRQAVAQINAALLRVLDSWGACAWWQRENRYLSTRDKKLRPVDFLGDPTKEQQLCAAFAATLAE